MRLNQVIWHKLLLKNLKSVSCIYQGLFWTLRNVNPKAHLAAVFLGNWEELSTENLPMDGGKKEKWCCTVAHVRTRRTSRNLRTVFHKTLLGAQNEDFDLKCNTDVTTDKA